MNRWNIYTFFSTWPVTALWALRRGSRAAYSGDAWDRATLAKSLIRDIEGNSGPASLPARGQVLRKLTLLNMICMSCFGSALSCARSFLSISMLSLWDWNMSLCLTHGIGHLSLARIAKLTKLIGWWHSKEVPLREVGRVWASRDHGYDLLSRSPRWDYWIKGRQPKRRGLIPRGKQ